MFGPDFRPWADAPRMELAFKQGMRSSFTIAIVAQLCSWNLPVFDFSIGHGPGFELSRASSLCCAAFPRHYQPVVLVSADGTKLSAGMWNNPAGPDPAGPPSQQRWIVVAMPNGQQFETALFEYAKYAAACNSSMLMFNYRGVGRSEGAALTAAELVRLPLVSCHAI
eukprot:SAG31_NODE_4508_length_3178_cov_14.175706_2_plen_167_part_00